MLSGRVYQEDDTLVAMSSQDCTAIRDDAIRRHNEGLHGSKEMRHVARIPQVIVEKYCNDNRITFDQFMKDPTHVKRIVQHPDNSLFRIWKGAL